MSQAFISYHRAQGKLARLIAHRIAAEGHSVWWDRGERPGDNWSEAVSTALANSACVIVIWSKQALATPILLGEATAGFGRNALINVTMDGTPAPAPFNRAPSVDLSDWNGESTDLAWVRMREPLRARLEKPEARAEAPATAQPSHGRTLQPSVAVGETASATEPPPLRRDPPPLLPPRTSQPAYRPPVLDVPPPPAYRERRGGVAMSALVVLVLGGLGVAAWQQRDAIRTALSDLQNSEQVATRTEPDLPQGAGEYPAPKAPSVVIPLPAEPAPVAPTTTEAQPAVAPVPPAGPPPAMSKASPGDAPRMTYDWRDNYTPPPVLRTAPRPSEPTPPRREEPVMAQEPAPQSSAAVAAAAATITLRPGVQFDLDAGQAKRAPDIFFGPDRTNSGLYLGVMNGTRVRTATAERLSVRSCATGVLRRTPLAARDLQRDGGLCVKSSDGAVSAWRVERIVRDRGGPALVLRAVTD